MSKVSVFDYGWIDLVFEGRNQAYGAYQLRRQDPKTTLLALFSGIGLMALLVGIPFAVSHLQPAEIITPNDAGPIVITPVEPYVIPKEEKKPEPIIEQPAAAAPQTPQATVRYTALVAATAPTDVVPIQSQVQTTDAATVTSAGTNANDFSTGITSPTGTPDGTGTAPVGTIDGPVVVGALDEAPDFPGGLKEFNRQVGSKFNAPETSSESVLKVFVSFVVEKDGTMTNIKVTRDPGYGMGQEAMRVLKSIKTKWKPGKIKGNAVRTAYNLPITVNVK
jgi:protein TonB